MESMWKASTFGFPRVHKVWNSKSSESGLTHFLPGDLPVTLAKVWITILQLLRSFSAEMSESRLPVSTGGVLPQGSWGLRCLDGSFPRELWLWKGRVCMPDPPSNKKGSSSSNVMNQRKRPTSWTDWCYFTLRMQHSQTGVPRTTQYFNTKKNKKAAQKCHWEVDFYIYSEQTGCVRRMQLWLHYFLLA